MTEVAQEASLKPTKATKPERTIEELDKVPVKSMTEQELKKYIDYLRDYKATADHQMETLKDAFSGLQKQKTNLEEEYRQFKIAANTQLQFCKDTLAQAFKAVHYMAPLEA